MRDLLLAYDTLKDPRDLAEVIHLAAGVGAEVNLIGKSLERRHWKVLRKLRSWRPELAEEPRGIERIVPLRFESVAEWIAAARGRGFTVAGSVIEGGTAPWSGSTGERVAVLFGEETRGLDESALALCNHRWTLPLGPGGKFYTVGQATALILGGALRNGHCAWP